MATTLLIWLLIALSPFSTFADVSWSINCGASSSYTDSDGVTWQGDDTLISTGQSSTVQITSPLFSTIRVFTSGEKNCYVLKGEKGAKLLVRASFLYGDYDGKSSPPSFDLQIDGNYWTTIITFLSKSFYGYEEVIYISKGDSISVCLVQTKPKEYPFISALEVRTLGSEMYGFFRADQALRVAARYAFGSLSSYSMRDGYGRSWLPRMLSGTEYKSVASTAISILTTTAYENPPLAVVQNAMTPSDSSARSMKLNLPFLSGIPSFVYINLYFSEVSQLDMTEKRSFTVYLDDMLLNPPDGITPSYGSVDEVIQNYYLTTGKGTTITMLSTFDSTLPPIINAMEVFEVIEYTIYSTETSSPPPGTSPPSGGSSPPTPSGGGSSPPTPSSTSPVTETSTSLPGKKKSSRLPVILGAGIPVFLLVVAFAVVVITMQQRRQRAAMAAAASGRGIGLEAAYNNNDNGQEQVTS